jgi:hypothetical protein
VSAPTGTLHSAVPAPCVDLGDALRRGDEQVTTAAQDRVTRVRHPPIRSEDLT